MFVRPGLPPARNAPTGRCAHCSRIRTVFEIDGTDKALCRFCIATQVVFAGELLATREEYEGQTVLEWLKLHGRHTGSGIVGCPFCGARPVS